MCDEDTLLFYVSLSWLYAALPAHAPFTADTFFSVCNISRVWTVECIFSKFLLDGIPANAVGYIRWRGWSRVSVHGED